MFQSLGNHEFDDGVSGLTPFIENLTIPVLAANLDLTNVPELKNEQNLRNSVIFDINGIKVGVIGYLTPDTKVLAIRNDVEYIDEVIAIRAELAHLQNLGVNISIALGHSGFKKDVEIAKEVEGIDLVIGGHTNTFLWNGNTPDSEKIQGPYPTVVQQPSGRLVPVVQAYAYTKYLGKLHLVFDSNGELISHDGNPILLDNSIPQDSEMLQIINKYHEEVAQISEEIIGISLVELDSRYCRLEECNLGNLISDAIVDKYASDYTGSGWTDAPIAIIQGGGIRASVAHVIRPFNITRGELLAVMPFDGHIVKATVKGEILLSMLEHSIAIYEKIRPKGQFLQFSGIKVTYDLTSKPGHRVRETHIRCASCVVPTYSKLDKNKEYNMLMPNFIAMGGDGFDMMDGSPVQSLSYNELDCTIHYINRHSPIFPEVGDRITFNAGSVPILSLVVSIFSLSNWILLT